MNEIEISQKISELDQRLKKMVDYQGYFHRETDLIQREIKNLKLALQQFTIKFEQAAPDKTSLNSKTFKTEFSSPDLNQNTPRISEKYDQSQSQKQPRQPQSEPKHDFSKRPAVHYKKTNFEKFIGENLISIIGIIITVIGVGIGAKYAIDHNLISPSARIIFGYLFGFGLLGFAHRLKTDYRNFSAVLLSGALAIMYFVTFAAHSYYNLIPQYLAFAVMFFLTDATVLAALRFNRQIIAQIGLVGAYALPFLLGKDSSNAAVLFAYTAVINIGILALSVKKYWKPLFYSSFIFTWASFGAWFFEGRRASEDSLVALVFATLFFLIFYITFLAYKLINQETFKTENVLLLLLNSFVFYGLGYEILHSRAGGEQFLGHFTIANAALHLAMAYSLKKLKIVDQAVFQMIAGLGLAFITISIPVQFDGNWVTLLWTMLAALLFWIGRTRSAALYEIFSYPLMILASFSLIHDWTLLFERQSVFSPAALLTPVFNVYFLTAILFAAAFAFIDRVNKNESYKLTINSDFYQITRYVFPTISLFVLYNAFRLEINNFWYLQIIHNQSLTLSNIISGAVSSPAIKDFFNLNFLAQLNYTMLFLTLLGLINLKRIKHYRLGVVNLALNTLVLSFFLTTGLFFLSELRASYLQHASADLYAGGVFHVVMRYLSYLFVTGLFVSGYQYIKQEFIRERIAKDKLTVAFDFAFFVSLWWLASSEIINFLEFAGYAQADKLGVSLWWSLSALILIIVGIAQNKKYLRVGAIVLSGLTIGKIFFYDVAYLDTISKTIVFVALGLSLLAISFLYNKYKHLIVEQN